jgi:thiol-disulfide isomerase/thioredoxin
MGNGNQPVPEIGQEQSQTDAESKLHSIHDVTSAELEAILDGDDMIVVMFYAKACGPCRATMPHYEDISTFFTTRSSNIQLTRMTAWQPPEQAQYCRDTWGVKGVPHFKIFYKRNIVHDRAGGGDAATLKTMLTSAIDTIFKQYGVKI